MEIESASKNIFFENDIESLIRNQQLLEQEKSNSNSPKK